MSAMKVVSLCCLAILLAIFAQVLKESEGNRSMYAGGLVFMLLLAIPTIYIMAH